MNTLVEQKTGLSLTGQAVLDYVLAFVAIALFVVGIVRIWVWFDVSYAHRDNLYQANRNNVTDPGNYDYSTAGLALNPDRPIPLREQTYAYIDGMGDWRDGNRYQPLDLTEKWVFGREEFTINKDANGDFLDPNIMDACKEGCAADPTCIGEGGFIFECACFKKCYCEQGIGRNNISISLRKQAENFGEQARKLREAAGLCSEWWQVCSWFSQMDKTNAQLNETANEMDAQKLSAEAQANDMDLKTGKLLECCEASTTIEQQACIALIRDPEDCGRIEDAYIQRIGSYLEPLYNQKIGLEAVMDGARAQVPACNDSAALQCATSCSDLTKQCSSPANWPCAGCVTSSWDQCDDSVAPDCREECNDKCKRTRAICVEPDPVRPGGCLEWGTEEYIDTVCSNNCYNARYVGVGSCATTYKDSFWPCYKNTYMACYDDFGGENSCFSLCYSDKRSACCRSFGCSGGESKDASCGSQTGDSVYGRDCEQPSDNCDKGEGSPKCGLMTYAQSLQDKLDTDIIPVISQLEAAIVSIGGCCDLAADQQTTCFSDIMRTISGENLKPTAEELSR